MRRGWKCSEMNRTAVSSLLVGWLVAAGPVTAERLPDPMRPPQSGAASIRAPVSEPKSWQLHMIRISREQRLAVINGRMVKPGDEVSGAKVVSVGPNSVQLRKGGKRFSLALARTSVKRPSAYGGEMMSEAMQGHDR